MKLKRTPTLSALVLASVGLVQPVQANDSGVCRKARSVLGEEFKDATEERCQQALDTADEERWELWLAVASAAELSGDLDRAALSLDRFVRDADKRGRLPSHWAAIRDEARTTIARLDGEVLKTKARVTINSLPEGAEVEVVGTAKRPNAERTPTTRYFTPGNHTLRLVLDTNVNREVAFSVKAGQAIELKVDLRPDAPSDLAVTETKAPAVLGSQASVEVVKTGPTDDKTVT
ncbi:MAG TPA: PEGA domain-containing protein, partial [Myxococcota bacterium]|nr:PEGA domain-containing protein [Myxococcota bacterium]